MYSRGAVFFDDNFRYLNTPGETGEKILILINTPKSDDHLILVKTTSQQHSKPQLPGCIDSHHKIFYMPVGSDILSKNTWIQLDDHFLFQQQHAAKVFKHLGNLKPKTIKNIVDCFLLHNEDDLSPIIKNMILPPVSQGIQALAAKFNNKR
ncbi:MAG: hypothetical protein F9K32_04500 [Desulfobulbaceae bacterium]|nr:MAG: hypothetical protein F9K32_04500 [Desulfobulbaceae bacterium]